MGAGTWAINGDAATVPAGERMGGEDQPPPPPMRKVDGVWKVDLSPPGKVDAKALAAQINQYTAAINVISDDLAAGKVTNLKQVEAALEKAPKFAGLKQLPPLVLAPLDPKK